MFCVNLVASTAIILSILLSEANCNNNDNFHEGIPTNPCIFTLCIENSTCISIPNPQTCSLGKCENMAICVPSGPNYYGRPSIYCGVGGEICPLGEKCELVQVYCFTTPCNPIPMCVPQDHVAKPISNLYPPPEESCTYCPEGQHCEQVLKDNDCSKASLCESVPRCMDTSGNTCANVKCANAQCFMTNCDNGEYDCVSSPVCIPLE